MVTVRVWLVALVVKVAVTVCAAVKGVRNPNEGRKLEAELKTKAEFVKALADSFALCDTVFATLTDTSALEFVKQGPGEVVAGGVLAGLLIDYLGVGTPALWAGAAAGALIPQFMLGPPGR